MTVWAEKPLDGGSAVWGCNACEQGGWCSDHTVAFMEARTHARAHDGKVATLGRTHGPQPDTARDEHIQQLRLAGLTIRGIATAVGLSVGGVSKALHRKDRTP